MKRMISLVLVSLTGCAFFTGADSEGLSDLQLCAAYGETNQIYARQTAREAYKRELERRALLRSDEWQAVDRRQIFVGMSQCGLYASWRYPTRQNRTVTARVERIQHVYGSVVDPYVRSRYVYTENGRVTAWQD